MSPPDGTNGTGALPTFGDSVAASTGSTDYLSRGVLATIGSSDEAAASSWGKFAQQMDAWGGQVATDEATRAGKVAGLDPNYRPDDSETTRGIAFRNAANTTYVNQVESNARQRASDAYTDYMALPADQRTPDKLQKSLGDVARDFTDNHLFPEVQGQFNSSFSTLSQAYIKAANDDQDKRVQDAAKAALIQNTNSAADTVHRLAATGSPGAAEAIGVQIDQFNRSIDAQVNADVITAVQAQKAKDDFAQSARQAAILGRFNSLPPEQQPAFLDRFQRGYAGKNGPVALSDTDRDILVRTVAGEAGGESKAGQAAVAAVIKNRLQSGNFGSSIQDVVLKPNQFSVWNDGDPAGAVARGLDPASARYKAIGAVVDDVFSGKTTDPTGGADHYYNPSAASPDWAGKLARQNDVTIGNHRFVGSTNPTLGLNADSVATLEGRMLAGLRQGQNQASQVQKAALGDIAAAQKQITAGTDVPEATWTQLQQQYGASADPQIAAAFGAASTIRNMLAAFKGLPPEEIEAQIATTQAGFAKTGATPTQLTVIGAAQGYLSRLRTDLAADPLARAAKEGVISEVQALPRDPTQLGAALPARIAQADQAAAALKVPPKLFLPDERANLKAVSAAGGPEMVQTAQALATALGPRLGAALHEIGGEAPALAGLAQVAAWNGSPSYLADAAEAQRLRHDPQAKGALDIPAQNNWEPVYRSTVGDALAAVPALGASVEQSARDTFGLRTFRDGGDRKVGNASQPVATRTIQERLGATFVGDQQYGGVGDYKPATNWFAKQKVLAPLDMRADGVGQALDALRDTDLVGQAVAGDGKTPVPLATMRGGSLVSIGHGQYQVALGDPKGPDPRFVGAPNGQRFVLDLNALAPQLRQRVPGIYKGAAGS